MKKNVKNAVEGVKRIANTLNGDAREFADAIVGALEQLEADEQEHDADEVMAEVERLAAELKAAKEAQSEEAAQAAEEVAEKIQRLRNEIVGMMPAKSHNIADKFTPKVRREIANAIMRATNVREMEESAMAVAKKNDISGIAFNDLVDYTLQLKQEDNDELFAELYKAPYNKFFVADLDPEDATAIAKQWNGLGVGVTEKDIQELAAEGKTIVTKNIYKRQRVANEVLDDVEVAGQEAEFQNSINAELLRAVQGLIVRAILVGDKVNAAGKRVTTFETIGAAKRSTIFTKVVNPTTPGSPDLLDIRKAADAVKSDYKIAVLTSDTKLALIDRRYGEGATPILLTDDELAAQLGVSKVYTRDFIADETGLHAIVFDPREYWVYAKKERNIAYPQYEKNVLNFQYELNCGGAIHKPESCAVVREATGSSSK